MSQSRLGIKVLGLCVVVLSLMAMGANAAQAETGANWRVKGANVTSTLLPSVQIKELENAHFTLLSQFVGIHIELLCKTASLISVVLKVVGALSGKIKLISCVLKLNGKVSAACEPHNGAEKGVVITNEYKGLLVLHEGAGISRLEPVTGETLATIETGEECAVGEKIPVIGKVTLKDAALKTESVTHLVSEGPLTELWIISKTAEHKATVLGSAVLELSGEHKGLLWSGLPG